MRSEYGEIEVDNVTVKIPRRLLKDNVKILDLCSVKIIITPERQKTTSRTIKR